MEKYRIVDLSMGHEIEMRDAFIVATPRPYIVDLAGYDEQPIGPQARKAIRQGLLIQVHNLRCVMNELGISEADGYTWGLTLNEHTKEELLRIAHDQGRPDVYDHIRKGW